MLKELHIINKCNVTPKNMMEIANKILPQVELERTRTCKRVKTFVYKDLVANIKYEKNAITIFVSKDKSKWIVDLKKESN